MWKSDLNKLTQDHVKRIDVLFVAASTRAQRAQLGAHARYHKNLINTLRSLGLTVNVTSDLATLLTKPKERFIYGIHSHAWFNGKEVFTSVLAEYHGRAYLGPPPTIRALSEDKKLSRILASGLGVPVSNQLEIQNHSKYPDLSDLPDGPWVVKPRNGIASQYISYCTTTQEIKNAISEFRTAQPGSSSLLIETYIPGRNFSIPIIEGLDQSFTPVFEEFDGNPQNILTFSGKRGKTPGYKSNPISTTQSAIIREHAKSIEFALRPYDYGRLDFRQHEETGEIYFLEANLICNASKHTVIAKAAQLMEVGYIDMIEHIVSTSFDRQFSI